VRALLTEPHPPDPADLGNDSELGPAVPTPVVVLISFRISTPNPFPKPNIVSSDVPAAPDVPDPPIVWITVADVP
jgi:hypothetical protein